MYEQYTYIVYLLHLCLEKLFFMSLNRYIEYNIQYIQMSLL